MESADTQQPIAKFTFPSNGELPKETVSSMNQSMSWCYDALEKIRRHDVVPQQRLATCISGRNIRTSSAFSGIGAPEIADDIVSGSCASFLNDHDHYLPPLRFSSAYAIEINRKC